MENHQIPSGKELILIGLQERAVLKQQIYRQGTEIFDALKTVLKELVDELKTGMEGIEQSGVEIHYKELSETEAEIKFGGDILLFSLHSNVFNFDDAHEVSNLPYVKQDYTLGYCNMIMIYNFLADSVKYNRLNDIGYLIGRMFVNRELHFYVEGKRQLGFLYNDFSNMILNEVYLRAIAESAILYTIDFDLLVPPYNEVQVMTVQQKLADHIQATQTTAKRMGFQFTAQAGQPKGKKS